MKVIYYCHQKKKLDEDLDLDINDTDEYNDNNFQINIKHPKLPAYNMSYFENKSNINNNPNINSLVLKSKNYHQNGRRFIPKRAPIFL